MYSVMARHWSTRFETGNQFIFPNLFFPICLLSFRPKQYLMQKFWVSSNLVPSDIEKVGYQEEHAKSLCGWIKVLYNILLRGYERYLPCL